MKYEVIHNIEFCAKPEQVCIPEALCAKAPFRAYGCALAIFSLDCFVFLTH